MKRRVKVWIFLMACFSVMMCTSIVHAQEDPINEAKKSIIEIYSGITDKKGNFHEIKHGSGVVISSSDSESYILTSYKFLRIKDSAINDFCEENKIEIDEYSSGTVYTKAVVKGDVLVDTQVIAESADKNFTILSIDNSMSEKVPLAIGDSDELVTGSRIYALGFAEDAGENKTENRTTEYTYQDVVIYEGSIEDTTANKEGIYYLQHSALVNQGNKGGPILDEDGYIVGINDSSISGDGIYYSLPINEVKTILDNYGLDYESKAKDLSQAAFDSKVEEEQTLLDSGKYKEKSEESLSEAVDSAKQLQEQGVEDIETLETAIDDMEAGEKLLEEKMSTNRKVILVFGVIDVLLFFLLIKVILDQKKLLNAMEAHGSNRKKSVRKKAGSKKEVSSANRECGAGQISAKKEASAMSGVHGAGQTSAKKVASAMNRENKISKDFAGRLKSDPSAKNLFSSDGEGSVIDSAGNAGARVSQGYTSENAGDGSGQGYTSVNAGDGSGQGYTSVNAGDGSGQGYTSVNAGDGPGQGYTGEKTGDRLENLMDEEEHTMILSANQSVQRRPAATLILERTGERIFISKPSFSIGKKKEVTDYAIGDNPAVSRLHASIIWDGENYFISDRGSANGTYVNGETVGKNQRYLLKDGDNIVLANEECTFVVKH